MSGFEKLRDESNFCANELQRTSLAFSVVTDGKIKDAISKKLSKIKLFSAKLKLLQAKSSSLSSEVRDQPQENALEEYGETVAWRLVEKLGVNYLTQAHAVKELISTPDKNLDPEMTERKKAIIDSLIEYHRKESWLSHLTSVLEAKEAECAELKGQWDKDLGTLIDLKKQRSNHEDKDRGPLFPILCISVARLELMRWLISQLVCARGKYYDWVSDPHGRISVLAITTVHHTVDMFTQD